MESEMKGLQGRCISFPVHLIEYILCDCISKRVSRCRFRNRANGTDPAASQIRKLTSLRVQKAGGRYASDQREAAANLQHDCCVQRVSVRL